MRLDDERWSGTGQVNTLHGADDPEIEMAFDRMCVRAEIEPRYVPVTIDRWEAFAGQVAIQL